MDVIFDKLAKLELDNASQYYELQLPGLGIRFEEEVKRGIRRILEYPNAWKIEKEDIRRYVLHRFPYKILYSKGKKAGKLGGEEKVISRPEDFYTHDYLFKIFSKVMNISSE